jgi:hypothetical protein
MATPRNLEPPLAEYFWIAGIDSISYGEHLLPEPKNARGSFTELLEPIQAEEEAHEPSLLAPTNGSSHRLSNGSSFNVVSSQPTTPKRLSAVSASSARSSSHSEPRDNMEPSSRSPTPSGLVRNSSTSSDSTITETTVTTAGAKRDFDFDKALLKFAAERDSFLEDLSFSAGTVIPNKPLMHPRAQKVLNEEPKLEKTNSLRRRISLRDLTSMRRSPSIINRACKFLRFVLNADYR